MLIYIIEKNFFQRLEGAWPPQPLGSFVPDYIYDAYHEILLILKK